MLPSLTTFSIADLKKENTVLGFDDDFIAFKLQNLDTFPFIRKFKTTLLGVCIQGEMHLSIDNTSYVVTANTLYSILTEHTAKIEVLSPDFLSINIAVSSLFIDESLSHHKQLSNALIYFVENPLIQLTLSESKRINSWFQLVCEHLNLTNHPLRREIISSLLSTIILDVSGLLQIKRESFGNSREHTLFVQFLRLLSQHCKRERSVSFYATELGVSPKYLTAIISKISGRNTIDWITRHVIIEAKSQLKNTDKNIYEIAQSMNFTSQSFFGKFFKSNTGMSPYQYRLLCKKNTDLTMSLGEDIHITLENSSL